MSVEPPTNGHTFGGPVPVTPTSARLRADDQLTSPVGTTGFPSVPRPVAPLPGPRFGPEPTAFGTTGFGATGSGATGFGPAPAGFPRQPAFGYPGASAAFGGGHPGFGDTTGLAQRPNTLAILALVFAFCSPLAGLVLGLIAKRQIADSGEPGDGMALTGIVVGAFLTVVTAVWMILGIIAWTQLGQAIASAPEGAATAL